MFATYRNHSSWSSFPSSDSNLSGAKGLQLRFINRVNLVRMECEGSLQLIQPIHLKELLRRCNPLTIEASLDKLGWFEVHFSGYIVNGVSERSVQSMRSPSRFGSQNVPSACLVRRSARTCITTLRDAQNGTLLKMRTGSLESAQPVNAHDFQGWRKYATHG